MTNLRKITEEEIKDYVSEVGDFDKEHRKYSSFYCWSSLTFTQEHIDEFKDEGVDASQLLNVCVNLNGTWDDSCGTEWNSIDYCKVEEYEELVPEKIIPAHTITKQRTAPFKPEFE